MQQKTSRLSYLSRLVVYRWVLQLVWQSSHTNLKELNAGKQFTFNTKTCTYLRRVLRIMLKEIVQ